MGSISSKGNQRAKKEDKDNDDINKHALSLIDQFVKGINTFKSNDMKQLKEYVGSISGSDNLNQKELLKIIGHTERSVFGKLKSDRINSDTSLFDEFKRINDERLQEMENSFYSNEILKTNTDLKNKVKTLFDPYKKLQTELMFYKYKYIQINIIFITVISQFQEVFDYTIGAVGAEYELRLQKQQQLLKLFINLAEAQSQTLEKDHPDMTSDINALANKAFEVLEAAQKKAKGNVEKLKESTVKDLLQILLDTSNTTVQQLVKNQDE